MEGRSQTASVKLATSQEQVSVRLKELGEPEVKPQGEGSHSAKEAKSNKHRCPQRWLLLAEQVVSALHTKHQEQRPRLQL